MKISGEQTFSVPANAVTISASESGYTLAYGGGDGTFTNWEESTPAGETLIVNGFARGFHSATAVSLAYRHVLWFWHS